MKIWYPHINNGFATFRTVFRQIDFWRYFEIFSNILSKGREAPVTAGPDKELSAPAAANAGLPRRQLSAAHPKLQVSKRSRAYAPLGTRNPCASDPPLMMYNEIRKKSTDEIDC